MKGETPALANQWLASSSSTTGATGRKSSRSLISLSRSCISARTGQAEVGQAGRAVQPVGQLEDGLLQRRLERVGDVVVALLQRPTPLARRPEARLQAQRPE